MSKGQNWKDENYLRIKDLMRKDIADQNWSQTEAAQKVLGIKDPRQAKQRIEKWLKPRDSDGKVREVPLEVMQMWSDYFDYDWEEFSLGRQAKERRRTKQAGGQS